MSIPILIDLGIGEAAVHPSAPVPSAPGLPAPETPALDRAWPEVSAAELVPLNSAAYIAESARAAGVAAVRILDTVGGRRALDPSVAASYLAGRVGDMGYLLDVTTTHNAPYNTARRVLSFDRASVGRAGVVVHPGAGDEVSDAVAPQSPPTAAQRWGEYVEILVRLWDSFPRAALLGDAERALVVDDTLIGAIDHNGPVYRVAGPLDGPSSVQGRPVVAATDPELLGWDTTARAVDVVIVEVNGVAEADHALTAALERVGRRRADVALVGRTPVTVSDARDVRATAARLSDWAEAYHLDAVELAPIGGVAGALAAAEQLAPLLAAAPGPTLRTALGLPTVVAALR